MNNDTTVGNYLLQRLQEIGLQHMFSVPRDYVLDFMDRVLESEIDLTGNCTGGFTTHFPEKNLVRAHLVKIKIGHHYYDNVYLGDYIQALSKALEPKSHPLTHTQNPHNFIGEYTAKLQTGN